MMKIDEKTTLLDEMNMGKITCYIPCYSGNIYSENVKNAIKDAGYQVIGIKQMLKNLALLKRCQIVNLNWFENLNSKNPRLDFISKFLLLKLFRLFKIKIVFTLHNKQPHTSQGIESLTCKLMKKLCIESTCIIGLCAETREVVEQIDSSSVKKVSIVHHPNYIRNYSLEKVDDLRPKFGFKEDDVVFLLLGYISPYKNIEMLIDCISKFSKDHIKLIVAGSASSDEYKNILIEKAAKHENIKFEFHYIKDQDIPSYYKTADIVILPYKKESMLNSGALMLSLSLRKTAICLDIGMTKDMKNQTFLYLFDYNDDSEQMRCIEEQINIVLNDLKIDHNILKQKGNLGYAYVEKNYSYNKLVNEYREIYDSLCC